MLKKTPQHIENASKSCDSDYKYYGKDYGIMDSYITYAYFQKNNVTIMVSELRREGYASKMENYINLLANKLSKLD